MLTALSPGQHQVVMSSQSFWFFSEQQASPKNCDLLYKSPYLISHHKDYRRNCDKEEGGACNNQHRDLSRLNSYLRHPSSNCRTKLGVCFHPGAWQGADLPDLDSQMVLLALQPGLPTSGKELSHSPNCCRRCLPAPSDQKGWWQLLDACIPVAKSRQNQEFTEQSQWPCLVTAWGVGGLMSR